MKTNVKNILVALAIMVAMVQCTKEKGKDGNDKVMNKKDTNEYYYLTYDEQIQAKESFNDFKKELLKKSQVIKDIHELKEYFITYADLKPTIGIFNIEVTVDDFNKALREGKIMIDEPQKEKVELYCAHITADAKEKINDENIVIDLDFMYNGFKKKWEINEIIKMPKP